MNTVRLTGSISSFNVPRYKRNPNATETNVNETMAKMACLSVISMTGVAGMFGLNLTSSLELVGSTPGSLFLLKEYSTSFVSCWSWLQDVTFSGSAVLVAMVTNELWIRPFVCLVYVWNNPRYIRPTDSSETSLLSLQLRNKTETDGTTVLNNNQDGTYSRRGCSSSFGTEPRAWIPMSCQMSYHFVQCITFHALCSIWLKKTFNFSFSFVKINSIPTKTCFLVFNKIPVADSGFKFHMVTRGRLPPATADRLTLYFSAKFREILKFDTLRNMISVNIVLFKLTNRPISSSVRHDRNKGPFTRLWQFQLFWHHSTIANFTITLIYRMNADAHRPAV